ncbi:MAG: serine hydrolase [Flavobacteriaceae bacterium]
MKIYQNTFLVLFLLTVFSCVKDKNDVVEEPKINPLPADMYFPPNDGTVWESATLTQLQWNETKAEELYDYLETKKTKGFIVLKDGRIVIEKYFNGHNQNAQWTWFSAAKSLTATFVGIAQDEGHININNKMSDYLGANWSQVPANKQDLITVKHHLSMSTGLNPHVGEYLPWVCTLPICLEYTADAGTRWAYHQGAFMLLQEMITKSTGSSFQAYCKTKLADKIGMKGNWTNELALNIYHSNTRSMARFGLLTLNKGKWDNTIIVSEAYFNEMTNTSQSMNKAYGYCWWLNGKESFMDTTYQDVTEGSLIPNAPSDMIAALGAGDQKIYVVPSKGLVVVRCGESAGDEQLGLSSFDNELWGKINAMIN